MPNRLANETSPYLLQHADNPVDWYPWGDEALALAKEQDKPILLSIGYAACHWCHVMAHESFEDPDTAMLMNRNFVNIKVDREERPDLDSIYMGAVVAMTGHGGWPMTVALTPDGRPFFGGTYFPPVPRHGMPAFKQVLLGLAQAWQNQRQEIEQSAGQIAAHLRDSSFAGLLRQDSVLTDDLFDTALNGLLRQFDSQWGGFGQAPKFPPSMTVEFLLRMALDRDDKMALHMAEHTLVKIAYGGMYDQLGGGFARYSTDERWLVPHFEKMLYDNALLARAYLHAWQVTGNPLYRRITEETLDSLAREMRHEDGGFFSSFDADSEGEEGKFYVWAAQEVRSALGVDAELFMTLYGLSERGNWEGQNILHLTRDPAEVAAQFGLTMAEFGARMAVARQTLYDRRAQRVWPGLDDKVLTAWNGLALAAFAEAGRVLGREDYSTIATRNAEFLYQAMRTENGRLRRSWKAGGGARYNAYLEDYAFLADGLLALYQTTFETRWFNWARELGDHMLAHFSDVESGGFFDTSDDHEALLHRPKDVQDNATPSGNGMAAHVLLRLGLYTGDGIYWDTAERMIGGLYEPMARYPNAFAHWLCAAALILGDPLEVAILGDPVESGTQSLLAVINSRYRPNLVVAVGEKDAAMHIPLLAHRERIDDRPAAYLCRRFVCRQPVTEASALEEQLEEI